ncbi:MAG: serine hydroxymethyltransferase [Candidatus Hadarchaeales archaeon]
MNPREMMEKTFALLKEHHEWFKRSIPLIASENVTSPAVREAMICDFQHRYAEGWPTERVYAGCRYIDQVEILTMDLAKNLFGAEHANVQPISGVVANLAMYTALTKPGDILLCLSIPCGGHISMGKEQMGGTAGAVHGLRIEYWPFDEKRMNIDVDAAAKKLREVKPKLALFGGSVFLFPHPLRELIDVAKEVGAYVGYDAAHVSGLIAGGQFQHPIREGVDIMTCSTHKTLPGPQRGMILCKRELADAVNRAVFPGVVSNHHLHSMAALAVALAEMMEFGRDYAAQIVKNSRALGKEMFDLGFDVLCPDFGFTSSHTIVVNVLKYGDGGEIERRLEEANIILNRNLLPWDIREGRNFRKPGGIRLGVSEVTRLGMKEAEMREIAEFIKRVVIDGESPSRISQEISEFRKDYQKIHYCFDSAADAYEYIELRKKF